MINQIIQNLELLALVLGLAAVLVIGFKLMQMILETIIAGAVSGIFYLGTVYLLGVPYSLQNLLLFMLIGTGVYVGLKVLNSGIKIARISLGLPWTVFKSAVLKPVKMAVAKARSKAKSSKSNRKSNDGEEDDSEVKETVLRKVQEDDD